MAPARSTSPWLEAEARGDAPAKPTVAELGIDTGALAWRRSKMARELSRWRSPGSPARSGS